MWQILTQPLHFIPGENVFVDIFMGVVLALIVIMFAVPIIMSLEDKDE